MKWTALISSVLCLLLPAVSQAQLRVETLPLPPVSKASRNQFKIPLIVGTPAAIADRINEWIQYTQLGIIAGSGSQAHVEYATGEGGTTSFDYDVAAQTSNLLGLDLTEEYMGAYPSTGRSTVTFDLGSGRPIKIDDLFTPLGLRRFAKRVVRDRAKTIHAYLATLSSPQDGDPDDIASMREQYQQCIGYMVDGDTDLGDLQLSSDALAVTADCGFPHVIAALDNVGPMTFSQSYAALKPDLSVYGKCLLLERRLDCRPATDKPHIGVYQGFVGARVPITVIITGQYMAADSEAVYFYDRIRQPIALSLSTSEPGHVTLQHAADAKAQVGPESFQLAIAPNGNLQGQWSQPGKPPLPVTLNY